MRSCGRVPAETSVPSDAANSSAAVAPAASTTPELPVVATAQTNLDVRWRSLRHIYKIGCDAEWRTLKRAGVPAHLRRPLRIAAGNLAVYVHLQKTLAELPEAGGPKKEPMVGVSISKLITRLLCGKTCSLDLRLRSSWSQTAKSQIWRGFDLQTQPRFET